MGWMGLLSTFSILILFVSIECHFPCAEKIYEGAFRSQVCVCNSTYCDDIEPIGTIGKDEVIVYRSTLDGNRMKRYVLKMNNKMKMKRKMKTKDGRGEDNVIINVDATKKYQSIIGFGGAFTDSAGENMVALSEKLQQMILESYFGENGLEYNIGRIPMASCDFSTHEYSYDDVKDDYQLNNFKLTKEDEEWKIPFVIRANQLSNNKLRLFASPWSSPGWMKKTGRMKGGGSLRDEQQVYQSYANYFLMFFQHYYDKGVTFWGMTIQNEPSTGADVSWKWQTLNLTAEMMRDFLRDYLGPVLKNNKLTKGLKVMILDDDRLFLPGYPDIILNDSIANSYTDGIGVHWYGDFYTLPVMLDITQQRHPDKFLLATEACTGYMSHGHPIMGDWFRGEAYADSIITDMNHYVAGWTDWNLVLNEEGGPNWVGNFVDAPIIANRTSQEFYKQPMFYALGHFSKFIPRGSKRVDVKVKGSVSVLATAVVIDGGRRVTVVLNREDRTLKTTIIDYSTSQSINVDLSPRSIHTFVWDKQQ